MKNLKEYFSFTGRERNGIVVLVFLIILVISITLFLPRIVHFRLPHNISMDNELDSFRNSLEYYNSQFNEVENSTAMHEIPTLHELKPENFDPNTVSREQLLKMGFPENVMHNMLKYRSSGGHFWVKEDLQKIYDLTPEFYNKLEPYINIIQKNTESGRQESTQLYKEADEWIDINRADSLDLLKIYGVGPVLASRIIKYRDLLGGYVDKEQLLEVYGIDKVLFISFMDKILIDTTLVNKLNLNRVDLKTLYHYPYLSPWQAKAIISYKEIIGNFKDVKEIEKNGLVPHDVFQKIRPYLDL